LVKSGVTELTSTAQTPTLTLTTPGTYDITMNVTTVLGSYSYTKKGAIVVGAATKNASCVPTSNNTGNFWYTVNNVTFNTINNSTNTYLNEGYKNFACEKSTIVAPGKSYPFSVSLRAAQSYSEFVEAYIDYNNNGVFETGELIYSGSTPSNTFKTLSASITIPINAVQDQPLRMRVIGEAGTSSISAAKKNCTSTFFIGDIEDYTIYISSKAATVAITASPSTTITYGNTVTFTATTKNEGTNPIYQWYINDNKIAGNSSSTFTSSTLVANDVVKCILISNLSGVTISPAVSNTITMNVTGVPLSNFKSSTIIPCTGENVTFTDLSLLSPTSWAWTFEGGTPASSTNKNPVVTYATPGVYKVTLTASNGLGTGTTSTKTNYIIVSNTPSNACSSITRANDGSQYGIGISRVDFNDISNVTSYSDAAFQDFSCSKKTLLTANTTYPIIVKTGPNTQWLRVYIDYNADGDFLDAGELVFSPGDATSQFSGSFTTQANPSVKNKILRMRIITDYPSNTSPSSCRSLGYGQAEDFGVIFKSDNCDNNITPTFTSVSSVCEGGILGNLPTTSLNGINGTWSPAINNTTTTTYTFTPNTGQCATTTTMTITVTPKSTPTFTAVSPICLGENLSALPTISNNSISGTWSPSINKLQTTTYTFTPIANQCGTNATMTIVVNPIPDSGIISGLDEICVGNETNISATVTGGTWSVSNENVATINQDGTLISNTAGSILINYTVTSINNCKSEVSKAINILSSNSLKELTGSNSVCKGSTINLTASENGGIWHSSNESIAEVTNGIVKGIASGTSTISYSIGSGDCYSEVTKQITIETTPVVTISGPSKICWNGRAMMRASVAGGIWGVENSGLLLASPQGLFRNSIKPTTDNFKSGVNYTLKSKLGACTSKVIKSVWIRNITAPSISITALKTGITVGETTTATASTTIKTTGTWSSTNTVVSAIVDAANNKKAAIKGIRVGSGANVVFFAEDATTGCRQAGYLPFNVTSAFSIVDVNSVQSSYQENIIFYPNPSDGKFTLENAEGATSVKLVDLTGRIIASQSIATGTATVDFSGVAVGKYLVHIAGESINVVQPIVIE